MANEWTWTGYNRAHRQARLRFQGQPCAHASRGGCGPRGKPLHMAYRHEDVEERIANSRDRMPYSTNPADYIPLCPIHHTAYDAEHGRHQGQRSWLTREPHG